MWTGESTPVSEFFGWGLNCFPGLHVLANKLLDIIQWSCGDLMTCYKNNLPMVITVLILIKRKQIK